MTNSVAERIRQSVGLDDNGHCMCCDTSNCCSALPKALQELDVQMRYAEGVVEELTRQRDTYQSKLAITVKALQAIAEGRISDAFAASGEMMHLAEETLRKIQG